MRTALQTVHQDSAPLRLTLEEALPELGAEDLKLAGVAVVDGRLTIAAETSPICAVATGRRWANPPTALQACVDAARTASRITPSFGEV